MIDDLYNLRRLVDEQRFRDLRVYAKVLINLEERRRDAKHRPGSVAGSLPEFTSPRGHVTFPTYRDNADQVDSAGAKRSRQIFDFITAVNELSRSSALADISDTRIEELRDTLNAVSLWREMT